MPFNNPTARAVQEALTEIARTAAWRTYHGPHSEQLRNALSDSMNRQHVRLCSSGTLGVELAIRSLKLPHDAEVLLAGYDYPGNFRAIQDAGASIALCDVAPKCWVPDVAELDAACGPQTRAIVVSHLHGCLAPMKRICEWAQSRNLFVIEDACQEPGAMVDDKPVGSWGDLSILSFGGSKLLSAGRGGAVLTNHDSLAQRMTIYCERGNDAYALSELQAAILIPQVQFLARDNALRQHAVLPLLHFQPEPAWLQSPVVRGSEQPAWYKCALEFQPMLLPSTSVHRIVNLENRAGQSESALIRNWLVWRLEQLGISVGAGFKGFVHRSSSRCRRDVPLKRASHLSDCTLVLSHVHLLDPNTGESTVEQVVAALKQVHAEIWV
jgi:perosamine synthetase